eukprot:scaffold174994_cov23-Tisochrysis_lutea.AAC.1
MRLLLLAGSSTSATDCFGMTASEILRTIRTGDDVDRVEWGALAASCASRALEELCCWHNARRVLVLVGNARSALACSCGSCVERVPRSGRGVRVGVVVRCG